MPIVTKYVKEKERKEQNRKEKERKGRYMNMRAYIKGKERKVYEYESIYQRKGKKGI